ncbi:BrnT family toxin [Sphingomonas sp. M1-B02]|uniref:BrnT family toxin n=1 Tax=Sphingomonas sp. M1-B02 TaxID=3114300 RepID=UPI00223EC918|nr:BrnT family toxin [Sphingomonas sp. S6-11]UZK65692.1 BrnT family toxin [Sphingomonas sp. S6-11]
MFEFDPAKSAANLAKHGIDFEAARALWLDDRRQTPKSERPGEETRWLVIGMIQDVGWTAIVTHRGDRVPIISVRRARKEEMALYGN